MNKERAREILKDFSQQLNDRKVMLPTNSEIYKDNEDLLQALDIAIESLDNEWVDIKDRLPKENERVLVTDGQYVEIAERDGMNNGEYFDDDCMVLGVRSLINHERDIIAWKPLPQPYERKE